MFVEGQVYRRRELHERFGGQQQGGISTPLDRPFILLFTSDSGEQYGYHDGWQGSGLFYYTGEGQTGDMQLICGNAAIANHSADGKDLFLFGQSDRRSYVTYIGQFICTGHHTRRSHGLDGSERDAIVFELAPLGAFAEEELPNNDDLDDLRNRATASSAEEREAVIRLTVVRYRSADVRRYVLRRAAGICEACKQPAPFVTPAGEPYLETHHIRRLSDGGPDSPRWVAGICANCHRRAHHGADHLEFNRYLADFIGSLET